MINKLPERLTVRELAFVYMNQSSSFLGIQRR